MELHSVRKVRPIGNSNVVAIPKKWIAAGEKVEIHIKDSETIEIKRLNRSEKQ